MQSLIGKLRGKGLIWHPKRFVRWALNWVLLPFCFLLRVRFVPVWFYRIGHLACEPDIFLKEGFLGLRPRGLEAVLAPANKVANRHLVDYWRQHLRIVTSPEVCWFLTPLSERRCLRYDALPYVTAINSTARFPLVQRMWANRAPLLSLTQYDRKRGWELLRTLGISSEAWFVCVHCRESGYIPEDIHMFRDADIYSYVPAMKEIVRRGGWCIRVGDPTMKPLPPMDGVIDYAHLDVKSDWMDVFLFASCKFFLGSSSGPSGVANVFGVPTATANHAPLSVVLPYGHRDIGIPKLLWSRKLERYLTFKEILDSPLGNARFTHLYTEAEVELVDNSPEDICDLAIEMLDLTEGTANYSAEDETLQKQFKSLMRPGHYTYGAVSRIGRDFLRRHATLLGDRETELEPRKAGLPNVC